MTDSARVVVRAGTGGIPGFGQTMSASKSLLLDKRNKKIAGVCAGFARYFEVDVILVRVLWLAVALATGVGFLAYLAAWMIMPSDYGLETRAAFMPDAQAT